jgi:hypothetical protein
MSAAERDNTKEEETHHAGILARWLTVGEMGNRATISSLQ